MQTEDGNSKRSLSVIKPVVVVALIIVALYPVGYLVLRTTHVIVHCAGAKGSWFEPEGTAITAIYRPLIGLEMQVRGLRYDPGFL